MAQARLEGSFTGTGQSAAVQLYGRFNLSLTGTFVGTVQLERSDSQSGTFTVVARDVAGTPASFTTAFAGLAMEEDEQGMWYRLNCTAYTSGTIGYRIGVGSVILPGQRA